jgi:hypothetical protein
LNRGRLSFFLVIVAILALLGIVARFISRYSGIDFRLTYLACMIAAYVAVSVIVAMQRSRLAARLQDLPAAQQAALAAVSPELRYATASAQGGLSARAATWVGAVLINGPLVPIMAGPLCVAQYVFNWPMSFMIGFGLLLLGFVLAWSWWSVGVTLWRRWAARRGVDPDELQWRGENATLLWPRGHTFEKTELGQLLKRIR